MEHEGETREGEESDRGAQGGWLELVLERAGAAPLAWLALLGAIVFLPWLEAPPMRGDLEAHRLEASREMFETGQLVVPTLDGEPYLAKPPGQYWAIELLSLPFGDVTLYSGRLLSALSSIGLVLLLAAFFRAEFDGRRALLAGFALLGSGVLLEKGILAELEAPLALATAASLFALWRAVWDEQHGGRWTVVSGLAMGAAILIKGPVAPLFLGTSAAGMALAGVRRRRVGVVFLEVLLIAVALASIWAIALVRAVGSERAMEVVGGEVVQRLESASHTNREPFWYYLTALFGALGPAVVLLPAALALRASREEEGGRSRSRLGFLAGWSALSLIALSFSSGKEVRYLIATLPGWAGLVALSLSVDAAPWPRWRRALRRFASGASALAPLLIAGAGWKLLPSARPFVLAGAGVFLVGRLLMRYSVVTRSAAAALASLALMLFGVKTVWARGVFTEQAQGNQIALLGERLNACHPIDEPVFVLGTYRSTLDFLIARPLRVFRDGASLDAALAERSGETCVLVTTRRGQPFSVPRGWTLRDHFPVRSFDFEHLHGSGPGFDGALGPPPPKKRKH